MTGIFIITYNTPADVFLCQIEAIKKFCKDETYNIEILDNSINDAPIRHQCSEHGISYTRAGTENKDPSRSHAFAANLAFSLKGHLYENIFYLDHDCIPVAPFNVREELRGFEAKGLGQGAKKTYFWPGCFMFSSYVGAFIDFTPNSEFGLDTGGNLYKMIETYGRDRFIFMSEEYRENPYYHGKYNFYSIIDGRFMHFINTSNWNVQADNQERVNSLLNIAKEKIDGKNS